MCASACPCVVMSSPAPGAPLAPSQPSAIKTWVTLLVNADHAGLDETAVDPTASVAFVRTSLKAAIFSNRLAAYDSCDVQLYCKSELGSRDRPREFVVGGKLPPNSSVEDAVRGAMGLPPGSQLRSPLYLLAVADGGAGARTGPVVVGRDAVLEAMTAELQELRVGQARVLAAVTRVPAPKSVPFSDANITEVGPLLTERDIRQGRVLPLPPNISSLRPASVPPFLWGSRKEGKEESAELAAALQALLGDCTVMDVRGKHNLRLESTDCAFSGFADAVVLPVGFAVPAVVMPYSCCVAVLDWKTQAVFQSEDVSTQALLELLGTSDLSNPSPPPPVFFTDMATGFRVWLLRGTTFHTFHGSRDLSLEDGVALLRYFIQHQGALSRDDEVALFGGALPSTPPCGSTALADTSPEEAVVALVSCSASLSVCGDGERAPPPALSYEERLQEHLEEHRLSVHMAAARLRAAGLVVRDELLP